MQWEDQKFAFEGEVKWIEGQECKLLEVAETRWFTCVDKLIPGESIFDIVYRLPGNRYYSAYLPATHKIAFKQPTGKIAQVWVGNYPAKFEMVGGYKLISFFRDAHIALPADLAMQLEAAIQADKQTRPRAQLERLRFPTRDSSTKAHEFEWDRFIRIVKSKLVEFIQSLRKAEDDNDRYSLSLRTTAIHLLWTRYPVSADHWWGDEFTIPPDFVDLFELPWPEAYRNAIDLLKVFRGKVSAWVLLVEPTLSLPVGIPRPTEGERQLAKQVLFEMRPELELDVQAFLRALGSRQTAATPDEMVPESAPLAELETAEADPAIQEAQQNLASNAVAPSAPIEASLPIFVRDKRIWRVTFQGQEQSVRHLVGMTYLSELVSKPDRRISATALACAANPKLPSADESSQPALDSDALSAIRDRINKLQLEIEEAEAIGNLEQIERLKSDQNEVARQMLVNTDHVGRSRLLNSRSEAHRTSVSAAIDRALTAIGEVHPALKRHLTSTIERGSDCVYRPSLDATSSA